MPRRTDLQPVIHQEIRKVAIKRVKPEDDQSTAALEGFELHPGQRVLGVEWRGDIGLVTIVQEKTAPTRLGQPERTWVFGKLTVHERCAGDTVIDPNKKYRIEISEDGVFQLYEDM